MFRNTKHNFNIPGILITLRDNLAISGLALTLFVFVSSCSLPEKRVSLPSGLIPRDTLVHLLVDIHLADAYLSQNRLPDKSGGQNMFYADITKKYGYDRSLFDSTIHYLATQPKLYVDIYDEVLNRLSLIRGQVEKEKTFLEENTSEGESFKFEKAVNDEDIDYDASYATDSVAKQRLQEAQKRFERIKRKE